MFALKIITANGNEVIHAAQDPVFNQASNTITFQGYDNLSNSVTLGEGLTSAGGDVAYLMGASGATLATWRYRTPVQCGSSLQPMEC
ncbi:hypothetical protein [Serratia marcescens]|uniref:hypothetical protein n=1 Tax=Serratia marcescens TaxID=615 RepID=UPI0013D9A989|nr:hypothetical protein [Serratia marcescens]